MKSVVVKKLHHRDQHCLRIYFEKDYEIINEVRKIPEVKFSNTNKCWYVPDGENAFAAIVDCLKGKV